VIRLESVGCRIGGTWALQGASLHVRAGELVGLTGPNGGGKSLLLAICATLVRADAGEVVIAGHDARTRPRRVRGAIGHVPESVGFYPDMTLRQDLEFFAAAHGIARAAIPGVVDDVLRRLDLGGLPGLRMEWASRGLLRRMALARALLHRPPVLLLDDPGSGLDAEARGALWRELGRHVDGGGCALVASHDTAELARHAHRVTLLSRGRIESPSVAA